MKKLQELANRIKDLGNTADIEYYLKLAYYEGRNDMLQEIKDTGYGIVSTKILKAFGGK